MQLSIVSIQILRVTPGIYHCSMEISRTKAELIKPVFLAVGIPLAFSLASIILEKIRAKKSLCLKAPPSDVHLNTLESNSHEFSGKKEILDLRKNVEELQERESMMEARFLRYHELKVQEFVLMEVENNLLLELAKDEFMDMEVSSMEENNQMIEEMVKEILSAFEELESSSSENVLLHQRIKMLMKRLKGYTRNLSEQNFRIEEMEVVIASKDTELVRKSEIIKKLEDETEELRIAKQTLQEEKNELLKKLEMAEISALTKKSEKETMNDYDQVVNELEQLKKDRAAETKELIYLRWCNACLRHKLFRMNQEQGIKLEGKKTEGEESEFGSASGKMSGNGFENESNSSSLALVDQSVDPRVSLNGGSNGHPKRRKLYEKFKKWVEGGGEKVRKNKVEEKKQPELKFFGSHSVADCGDETHFSASKLPKIS